MKLKSAVVGALALATSIATVAGTTTAGAVASSSPGAVQTTQQYTGSKGVPVKGDFNGDGRDDVFWYVAGSGADSLWLGKALDDTSSTTKADRFTVIPKAISGTYTPVVGDFNGDGRDDIFWYGPGTAADSIWFGADGGVFASANVSISGTYTPLVANFNVSGASASADDIFWYNPNGSSLWSGSSTGFTTQSYAVKPPKNAKPYIGNWRQSSMTLGAPVYQDILFYVPGTAADSIWVGNGTGTFTQSPVTINGNYDPIIGNFDGTTTAPVTTDIFWYAPGTASDSIWMNTGSGFANVKQIVGGQEKPVVVNGKTYKPVVIPAKVAGQADDILWNNPAGTGETIWNMTGTNQSFAYNVVNLSSFGGSDPLSRTALVGDFDVMDATTSTAVLNSKVAVGDSHTCALTPAGGVECWGANSSGQLGNGKNVDSLVPVDVSGLSSGVVGLSAGANHTCAVTTDGGVKCWGAGTSGQLGNGGTVSTNVPVSVTGLSSGVTSVDLGASHSCAVLTSGNVKCWGANGNGELGNNSTTASSTPVSAGSISTAVSVSAGGNHTCATTAAGGVQCWGLNSSGQLGNNGTTGSLIPVSAAASGFASVSTGANFTCGITTTNGGVKCWGSDGAGQQGNGSGSSANVLVPTDVSGVTGMTTMLTGGTTACARTVAGDGKCWGTNASGQFGNNTAVNSVSPVTATMTAGYGVAQAAGANHACAVGFDGVARCWGSNASGQFGNGTTTSALVPTSIVSTKFNVDSPTNVASTDIFFVSLGDAAAQKEVLWTQLGWLA